MKSNLEGVWDSGLQLTSWRGPVLDRGPWAPCLALQDALAVPGKAALPCSYGPERRAVSSLAHSEPCGLLGHGCLPSSFEMFPVSLAWLHIRTMLLSLG